MHEWQEVHFVIARDSYHGTQRPLLADADAHWTDHVVTQGNVDYCAAYGHCDDIVGEACARCGERIDGTAR